MRPAGLRKQVLQGARTAVCGLCGKRDASYLFDVDHKIPLACDGPNEAWNLWTLCVTDHRRKCRAEEPLLRAIKSIADHVCWSCLSVSSRFFATDALFCSSCARMDEEVRQERVEETVRKLLHHFETRTRKGFQVQPSIDWNDKLHFLLYHSTGQNILESSDLVEQENEPCGQDDIARIMHAARYEKHSANTRGKICKGMIEDQSGTEGREHVS